MNNLIFSGSASTQLTNKICEILRKSEENEIQGSVQIAHFPAGETYCEYLDNLRGKNVFIVQSTARNVNDNWMELFMLINTAKRASAKEITVLTPFFSYSRQDRKTKPRSPISARLMIDLLEKAGATRIITVEIHNPAIQGFASIPLDSLIPCNLVFDYLNTNILTTKTNQKKWILCAPDLGSIKRVEKYAEFLGMDFCVVHKRRLSATKTEAKGIIGNIRNKNIFMIDDMSESLGTLLTASNLLKEKGAKKIYSFVTHLPLTQKGIDNLNSANNIDKIITTDTIDNIIEYEKIEKLSVAPILAEAISCTMHSKSISKLYPIKGF